MLGKHMNISKSFNPSSIFVDDSLDKEGPLSPPLSMKSSPGVENRKTKDTDRMQVS
jgi:hypothetical protein